MTAPDPIRPADPRRRILDAARTLFAERGAESVTMAEVAKAAGVARATVFNHFGSKHALVEGITEEVLDAYEALLDHAVSDDTSSVSNVVRRLFATMAAGIARDRMFYRGVFREISKLSLGLDEGGPGQRARQRNLELMRELVARGQSNGELTRDHSSADLASALGAVVFGTITHWLYEDVNDSLDDRMCRAAEVFLDGAAVRGRDV